jgi:NAD(P)H-dependent FMN reductase
LLRVLTPLFSDQYNVELINLSDYNILPCAGCLKCLRENKTCILNDQAQEVILKIQSADSLILATPVYFLSANSLLKTLLDRLLILDNYINYDRKKPGAMLMVSGRPGWEGVTLQMASILILASGYRVKAFEHLHGQGPADILIHEDLDSRLHSFVKKFLNPSSEYVNPATYCPVCFTDSFNLIDHQKVICPICNIKGEVQGFVDKRAIIHFDEADLLLNRWTGTELKQHMQEWVAGSVDRYRTNLREIVTKRKELLKDKVNRS